MLGVSFLIAFLGIGSDTSLPAILPLLPPADLVSSTRYDIDGDQRDEILEIILVEGQRYVDEYLWCGMGEKWEGQFVIQVRRGSVILSRQSLNDLMGLDDLFFKVPRFELVLQDYNQDGRIDFNLGQYTACNWYSYALFTVNRDGRIARLEGAGGIIAAFENSTEHVLIEDGLVGFEYYTQDTPAYATKWYAWNGETFHFAKMTYSDVWQRADNSSAGPDG